MDGWMDGWMDEWMDGWMDGWIDRYYGNNIFLLVNFIASLDYYSKKHAQRNLQNSRIFASLKCGRIVWVMLVGELQLPHLTPRVHPCQEPLH